jgi:hypothetical protein
MARPISPTRAQGAWRGRKVGQRRRTEPAAFAVVEALFAFPDLGKLKFFYTTCRICDIFFRWVDASDWLTARHPRIEGNMAAKKRKGGAKKKAAKRAKKAKK